MRVFLLATLFVFVFPAASFADAAPATDEVYSGFGAPFAYTQYGAFGSGDEMAASAIASNARSTSAENPQTPSDIELQNILQIEPAAGDEAVTE